MIKAPQLLADLTRLLKRLEEDLLRRIDEVTEFKSSLQAEWKAARDADRTAETFETWVDQVITQAGVHWLLSCVFLRFIEDNKLVDRPWLGGTPESGNLALARDRHEAYFRANPLHSDREYLLASFREAGTLPGLHTFFDEGHNPVFRLGISGDAAMAVRQFWQQVDPNTGALAHDFTDPTWNTRFLGDLYQDLSEATRKRYALLQTPEFVEEFILDRTLTPAIREFGYRTASLIDPTCGSGHFLLGAFHRFVDEWQRAEPSRNRRDIAQKALDAVAGVDLNPFAVAISRFRLLVAALLASDVHKLSEAPDFRIHVAIGDSLLHGKRFGMRATEGMFEGAEHYAGTGLAHAYASEDLAEVQRILGRQYHAVVGNPPYIVVRDAALNATYRLKYTSCHRQYSLGVPFTERFFEMAVTGNGPQQAAGFVGLITTNSFMKREFGSKLIEQLLPQLDLSHVIDTSGAYIPGHGTPTVILFGRHQRPLGGTPVRTVMGIKGEPPAPADPAQGLVWQSILAQIDNAGSESEFISVSDTARETFGKHPWSIGGGGTSDLKELIETDRTRLADITTDLGFVCITKADDVFVMSRESALRGGCNPAALRLFGGGEEVRDWQITDSNVCLFPYDVKAELLPEDKLEGTLRFIWRCKTALLDRKVFGGRTYREAGKPWYSYGQIPIERFKIKPAIVFASIATHNHFTFDRDGRVFKQSAPVIKLPAGSSEKKHLELLGLLNSSTACFWLKQVSHNKGEGGGTRVDAGNSALGDEAWKSHFEFTSTSLMDFPIPKNCPTSNIHALDSLATLLRASLPAALLASGDDSALPTRSTLNAARDRVAALRRRMVAVQEELDWMCYGLYGLLPEDVASHDLEHDEPPEVRPGERAFEIALARRIAAGQEQTTWFDRHGSSPVSEIPSHWPESYRLVVKKRLDLLARDRRFLLIERPEYKRRWSMPAWQDLEQSALRNWLLARMERPALWPASSDTPPQLTTTNGLADAVRADLGFMHVAALYAGHADFDVARLVAELVVAEAVPQLPVQRYNEAGLRKCTQWQDTWSLQRREDAGEDVGRIPVPPRYKSSDFIKADFWRLRGGMDMPKERWVSYPGCERGADTSLPLAWAGWDHLQQATALASYYLEMKESEGWEAARLQPLLTGLLELVPWLERWHNEVDPVYGERMGAYYRGFVSEEARSHGFTLDDLRAWKPAVTAAKRGRKKAST